MLIRRCSAMLASVTALVVFNVLLALCPLQGWAQSQSGGSASSSPKSKDFFVSPQGSDSNNGSQSQPWATITHASKSVGPGATVHVGPGTYAETVITSVSGTASARIAYVSDTKWGAIITSGGGRPVFVWNNTGDYTDVVGFNIYGHGCIGLGMGGSFQRAERNNVHNTADGCNENPASGAGIDSYDYDRHDNDIVGNFVHDVGIGDALCGQQQKYRSVHGIYLANPGGHITSNLVVDNCGFGIHLWHAASHVIIANNTVLRNRSGGIIVGSGDKPCSTGGCEGNDYTVVTNNIVAYNGNATLPSYGIVEQASTGGRLGAHNRYSHNLSFKNRGGDFLLHGNATCESCIQGKDPGFASIPTGDFHLKSDSPAVAGGTSEGAPDKNYDGKVISAGGAKGVHIGALGQTQ